MINLICIDENNKKLYDKKLYLFVNKIFFDMLLWLFIVCFILLF